MIRIIGVLEVIGSKEKIATTRNFSSVCFPAAHKQIMRDIPKDIAILLKHVPLYLRWYAPVANLRFIVAIKGRVFATQH